MYVIIREDKLGNKEYWNGEGWDYLQRSIVDGAEGKPSMNVKVYASEEKAENKLMALCVHTSDVSPDSGSVKMIGIEN